MKMLQQRFFCLEQIVCTLPSLLCCLRLCRPSSSSNSAGMFDSCVSMTCPLPTEPIMSDLSFTHDTH